MLKKEKFKLFFITLFLLSFTSLSCAQEIFLSLKKSKVNVRYGPSFESPIKFIYKKVNLPLKQIDKKENWRRVIDFKNNSGKNKFNNTHKRQNFIRKSDKFF